MEIKLRLTEPNRRQRFAIMVTKETHCFDALMAAKLKADAALVIGNYADFAPRAKKFRLPFAHINWNDRAQAEARALQLLEEHEIDFIVLARFMKILSPNFVWRYKNKIINIHPSLLPSFPGPQAYRQAYEQRREDCRRHGAFRFHAAGRRADHRARRVSDRGPAWRSRNSSRAASNSKPACSSRP